MQPSEEIKAKLDIVDLIGEYIQLRSAGANFRANCPFHRENSPSFMVSPEKQIWHCFGCGKGGDIFSFVMEMDGLEFVEAMKILATKAGVVLREHNTQASSKKGRLLEILDWSRRYYKRLLSEKMATPALDYLYQRGLSQETIDDWQIGYASESWDDLGGFLRSKGYKDQEILASGMASQKPGTTRIYNRFRGRIMFPISDANSQTVGFSARVMPGNEDKDKMGKYVNSPQSLVYDKSALLFGLDRAKTEIRAKDLAVIVEGQMDVISAHQAGFKNVVAQSGTALTPVQIKLLSRYTRNLAFALDADEAGQTAITRGEDTIYRNSKAEVETTDKYGRLRRYLDPLLNQDLDIKVIEILNGKDPDDCIRQDPEAWRLAVAQAKPIMRHHFDRTFKSLDTEKVEDKRRATRELLPKIIRLSNRIEQDFWLRELAETIRVEESILRELIKDQSPGPKRPEEARVSAPLTAPTQPLSREERQAEFFLASLLKFFYLLENLSPDIKAEYLFGSTNQEFYKNLLIYYNEIVGHLDEGRRFANVSFDHNNFRTWLSARKTGKQPSLGVDTQLKKLDVLLLLGEEYFSGWTPDEVGKETRKLLADLKKASLQIRRRELEQAVIQAERNKNSQLADELLHEIKRLSDEINSIKR